MLFEITGANIGQILNFAGELFLNFKPLFYLFTGLILGNLILNYIVDIIRERAEKKEFERKKLEYIGKKVRARWERRRAETKLPEVKEA